MRPPSGRRGRGAGYHTGLRPPVHLRGTLGMLVRRGLEGQPPPAGAWRCKIRCHRKQARPVSALPNKLGRLPLGAGRREWPTAARQTRCTQFWRLTRRPLPGVCSLGSQHLEPRRAKALLRRHTRRGPSHLDYASGVDSYQALALVLPTMFTGRFSALLLSKTSPRSGVNSQNAKKWRKPPNESSLSAVGITCS